MKGVGNKNNGIMIVGEAPGLNEDEQGIPFIGKAGQLLTQTLKEYGLSREDCYITNAVKCRPPQNRTPSKTEIKACQKFLLKEIKKYRPKYILTVGNVPLDSILGKSGIMKYRGQVFEAYGAKVYPTLHPAGVLRNPKYLPLFKGDISRFVRATKGLSDSLPEYQIKIIKTWDQLEKLKKKLKKKVRLAYDFEASGVEWRYVKLWLLGVATSSSKAYIIPLQHPQSPFKKQWKKVLLYLKDIFEDKNKFLIAQNGKYDNKLFRREGIEPFQKFDTMLAAHLLDENTPNNLEYLSMTMLGTDPYKKRYSISFDPPSPLKKMAKYCGEDCCNTFAIAEIQINQLADDPRLENIFYNLKMPASRLFEKVEMNGLWVDAVKLHKNSKEVTNNLIRLEKELNKLIPKNFPHKVKVYRTEAGFKKAIRSGKYGDDVKWTKVGKEYHIYLPFNWGSTQQLAQILYLPKSKGGWGLVPPDIKEAKTRTGNEATGEPVLVHLRDQHPGIELLIEYKGWRQLYNNFIKSWKDKLDPETSRLYPTFKLHGTVTHRLSSENPNPQQTPRNKIIRGNIGAPPGKIFIEADYSQVELRIAAFISGCPVMTRAFQVGEDIHTKTAVMLSGLNPEKMSPEQLKEFRKKAKPVNFGFLYGMWWKTFQQYAFQNYGQKFTDEEAEEAREKFFKTYIGLEPWHRRQKRLAEKLGYVRYPDGTIRRLPDIYSTDKAVKKEAEKQAINSPVQGFASNICLLSAIVLDKILDWNEIQIVLSMHDALMFECDEDKAEKWLPIIKKTMENPPIKEVFGVELTVPIKVDVAVGKYWGELEEWNGKS
jgi:DNA polymerase-1